MRSLDTKVHRGNARNGLGTVKQLLSVAQHVLTFDIVQLEVTGKAMRHWPHRAAKQTRTNSQTQWQSSAQHGLSHNTLATYKYSLTIPSDHAHAFAYPTDFAKNTAESVTSMQAKQRHVSLDTNEINTGNLVILKSS